jgi:hypothetical protein
LGRLYTYTLIPSAMARQDSLIPLTGSVGNIIFYKSIDGYLARKKGGISAHRIHSEPSFARTRENNAEFKRAAQATKLIRTAFGGLLKDACDTRMTGRLNGAIVKVIRADAVNSRGERNLHHGDVSLLQGFDFNKNARLSTAFLAPFTTAIDRPSGAFTVDIPAFVPGHMIHAPEGATHFRLKAGGAAMNFETKEYVAAISQSAVLPLTEPQGPLQLNIAVTPGGTNALLLVFGIGFMQVLNGVEYPLIDRGHNAMAVVRVDATSLKA